MAAVSTDIFNCCRPCLRRLASQNRAFTTSTARPKHGPLPTFQPTPSADLDALLSTFRTNIFLPAHLIRLQKDLVYRKKNWPLLASDEPATVRLGDEVLQLRPLDRTKDEPKTRPSFAKVLGLMQESGDWRNLPGFLEGLKSAHRRLDGGQVEKMVRKCNEAGRMGVVLDCLRRVEGTGTGLWDVRVAREVVWGAAQRMVQGGWWEEAVGKAGKFAENVWELMWDERHARGAAEDGNSRTRPEVLGAMMQVHAAKVVLFGEGKDEAGLVNKYARLMLKSWDNAELGLEEGNWNDANYKLVMWAPVWHGMKMARKVLGEGSPLGKSLASKMDEEVEPLLAKAQDMLQKVTTEGKKWRGLSVYEEVLKVS